MAHSDKIAEPPALNHWEMYLKHWCPAQMFYYFQDSDGEKWCIYLRWDGHRGDEPWQAELCRCNDDWSSDNDVPPINLLEEKEHIPGIVTGFYRDEEYPFLMGKILELAKERFPDLDFPNNQ